MKKEILLQVVLNGQFLSCPSISKSDSHFTSPCFLGCGFTVQIPSVGHHQLEIVVVGDGAGDRVVVLEPLVHGHGSVSSFGLAVLDGVGLLECVEEFVEDVLLGLLARHHIWVLLRIVPGADVVNVQDATAILVDLRESFLG